MATEQANHNKVIAHIVPEATRVVIRAMAMARAERTQNVGPKPGRPIMKQLTFN